MPRVAVWDNAPTKRSALSKYASWMLEAGLSGMVQSGSGSGGFPTTTFSSSGLLHLTTSPDSIPSTSDGWLPSSVRAGWKHAV